MIDPKTPSTTAALAKPQRSHWPWALVFIVGIGALVSVYVFRSFLGLADKATNITGNLIGGMRPEITFTTQINSALGEIKHTPKMIVNTYEVDVDIQKGMTTQWAYVYWGTTVVEVRAHGNKVQYYVPVESLGTSNFSYDSTRKILKAIIPPPRVDESVVEVQSDPSKMDVRIDKGWSHLNSGEAMKDDAMRELRAAVIQAGKGEAQMALAEKDAKKAFERLLEPVASAMGGDVTIEVEFEGQ